MRNEVAGLKNSIEQFIGPYTDWRSDVERRLAEQETKIRQLERENKMLNSIVQNLQTKLTARENFITRLQEHVQKWYPRVKCRPDQS